jgi:hypothetical protein
VPGAIRQPAPPDARPTDPSEDPRLARLPTEEEIAEEVRRRPIGAVIVDICCDLGIAPGDLERGFWDEINIAIIMYGGSGVRFFNDLRKRSSAFLLGHFSDGADPGWPAAPQRLPVPATGPP